MWNLDFDIRTSYGGRFGARTVSTVAMISALLVWGIPESAPAQEASGPVESDEADPESEDDSAGEDSGSDVVEIPTRREMNRESRQEGDGGESDSEEAPGEGGEEGESSVGATDTGPVKIPEVEVVGRSKKEVEEVPGSANVVTEEEIENQQPLNSNEVLRMLPGVHIQPEEGMGLRQNIGIRGLNPTRSRKVHVMEDGVPIALAPYGEPEMYYTPPVERMSRIEVVKGSGSILYGPQTVGGVVNYITPQPPEDFTVEGEARGGSFGHAQGEVMVGGTKGNVGYWLKGIHQRMGGHRRLNLRMTDATSKFRFELGSTQTLSLKFNVYDEWSRSTYLGLTRPQFREDPSADFAPNDRFKIRRYGAQATHVTVPSEDFKLETRLYGHNIRRNWRRQDFDRRPTCEQEDCYVRVIDEQGRNVTDDPSQWPTGRGGVFFRDSTGNRNREFTVGGIEPRATIFADLGEAVDYELQTGTRFHVEHTRERRLNGNTATSPAGDIRDDDERLGRALAVYGLNKFKFFDKKLQISPGLRFESLWTTRTTFRTRIDGTATDLDPPRKEHDHISAVIPGAGVNYQIVEPLSLFGGVHRGFSPPRTKDAITKTGERLNLEPEFSWNYEAGARVRFRDWLQAEAAGFIKDFQNQIIAPAEAGGAVSTDPEETDPGSRRAVQGGQTIHRGAEFAGTIDPATKEGLGFDLPISVSYTFVDAKFQDGWKTSIKGNELPYSPDHMVSGRIGFQHPNGLKLQLDGDWISGQFTDKTETVQSNEAGLRGWIDSRFILDANVSYTYDPWGVTALVAAKNILDERYIASRAPRGIKPGLFRQIIGGIRVQL